MKKRISVWLVLIILLVLGTGCGRAVNENEQQQEIAGDQESETSPDYICDMIPKLEVVLSNNNMPKQQVSAIQLVASWSAPDENGDIIGVNIDSPHPLRLSPDDLEQFTVTLNGSGDVIELLFTNVDFPQNISICRWYAWYANGAQDISEYVDKGEAVAIEGNIIKLNDDGQDYIYEVVAKWEQGYCYYAFRTLSGNPVTDS